MRNDFKIYGLILLTAVTVVSCSMRPREQVQLLSEVSLIKTNFSNKEVDSIMELELTKCVIKNGSMNDENGKSKKINLITLSIYSNTDSIIVKGLMTNLLPKQIPCSLHYFDDEPYEDRLIKKDKQNIFYWYTLSSELKEKMRLRYYFKTSQFKDSLMWHDVYYTLKNDSFIIVRQTENEK